MLNPARILEQLTHLFTREIWKVEHLDDRSLKGRAYALLRLVSIFLNVFSETKAMSRAAALSYSSLLGLGPLIAITILVAGFVLNDKNPDLVVDSINKVISVATPQVAMTDRSSATDDAVRHSSELNTLISEFVEGSRSGTAGALGIFSLIFIVLMLFTTIENAFNEIWGVRQGRSWVLRIVFYWTIVTLGAVLFFTSLTLMGAGAFFRVFLDNSRLPKEVLDLLRWSLPLGSFAGVVAMLTLFYRFVPNTRVLWRCALAGALVATVLIYLNNLLAFTYFRSVLQTKSLYGSVSIIPILMMGLYIFWLFVLVGGQVSYAIQNLHFRNSQAAWSRLSEGVRERVSLGVLLAVCRRFLDCKEPCTACELGEKLKVPTQIVNECLNRLIDARFICAIPDPKGNMSSDLRYMPARPLSKITLLGFKRLEEGQADQHGIDAFLHHDPLLHRFDQQQLKAFSSEFFTTPLDRLFAEEKAAAEKH